MYECSALPTDPRLSKGLFVRPVLFTNIDHQSPVVQEEIFGPVTAVMKWSDPEAMLNMANSTPFGLSASVWTNDMKFALQATKRLEAGIVQVNQNLVVQPNLPFGGFKVRTHTLALTLAAKAVAYVSQPLLAVGLTEALNVFIFHLHEPLLLCRITVPNNFILKFILILFMCTGKRAWQGGVA